MSRGCHNEAVSHRETPVATESEPSAHGQLRSYLNVAQEDVRECDRVRQVGTLELRLPIRHSPSLVCKTRTDCAPVGPRFCST